MLRNSYDRYGYLSIGFHWLMAILMIGMLALGLYMVDLPKGPDKFELYALHKSFGVLILILAIFRIIWRFINIVPQLNMPALEKFAARAVHFGLYFFMLAMPISGWMMSSSGDHAVSFFNLFTLPAVISPNKTSNAFFAFAHEWLAYFLIAVIVLHILAALKHHFYNKDDILRRMLG